MEEKFVFTGGIIDGIDSSTVSIYDNKGWVRNLPNLQNARNNHGCGHYIDDRNNIVGVGREFKFY